MKHGKLKSSSSVELKKAIKVLNEHLLNCVHTHDLDNPNEFEKTERIRTNSVKIVTYKPSNTKFVVKNQEWNGSIREIVSRSLYKALLYSRSPQYKLMKNIASAPNAWIESNLLKSFENLDQFMKKHSQQKLKDIVEKKLSDDKGKEELAEYLAIVFPYLSCLIQKLNNLKYHAFKKGEELSSNMKGLLGLLEREFPNNNNSFSNQFDDENEDILTINIIPKITPFIDQSIIDIIFSNLSASIKNGHIYNPRYKRYLQRNLQDEDFAAIRKKYEEVIKNYLELKESVINHTNNELNKVTGIEKIIAAMLLLDYRDMHASNIGVMKVGSEKVFAKVDMSASSFDYIPESYNSYADDFIYLAHPRVSSSLHEVRYNINFQNLKEEIHKIDQLFTEEYVESLIYRSLLYTPQLLKTKEEMIVVKELVDVLMKRKELLTKFADSKDFEKLSNAIADSKYTPPLYRKGVSGPILNKLEKVIKNNINKASGEEREKEKDVKIEKISVNAGVPEEEKLDKDMVEQIHTEEYSIIQAIGDHKECDSNGNVYT